MELLRLRIHDIDFDNGFLTIRAGKGDKDRTTLLPVSVREALQVHLQGVRSIFEKDLQAGHADVKTTEIDTHVLQRNPGAVQSPPGSL